MPLGRASSGRRTVSLEEGAAPGAARCPACGKPLFVWLETEGWGPREDQVIDRCENCGLAVPRDSVPTPEEAIAQLLGPALSTESTNGSGNGTSAGSASVVFRAPNSASLQAWLGAENWAALRPDEHELRPSPRAAELLLAKHGLDVVKVRFQAAAGMASMWQTLLNLLTFHRNFAIEALSGRLRPATSKGRAAYAIDVLVTILASIPTAILAVLLEGGALVARRGGVFEVRAHPLPPDPDETG